MARYTIDFSTNASTIVREIEKINAAIAKTARTGKSVSIDVDTSSFTQSINASFKQLDKQIAKYERQLRKLKIGGPEFIGLAGQIGAREGARERGTLQAQSARLKQQAGAFEPGSAIALTKALQAAKIEASQIKPGTEEWIKLQQRLAAINLELKQADKLAENIQMQQNLGAFSPGSLNALEAKLTILRNRAREISPNTTEWKQLNKEIVQTEQAIERQTRRPLTKGQRFGAAGGAFLYGGGLGGGVGSAVGGIAGGLIGGVPGAFTGAAIGQTVDNLQAMTAGMIEQAVTIRKLQMGLATASNSFADFAQATQEVEQIASRLLIPLDQAYKKFTQLRASTVALGIDTETTGKLFEGTAAAVLRAGGSMDDVDGAMRAVVQVFSKGKLTAEELRGQLAERLPGAVVEFAQSAGMSVQQLDKAFEAGETSIDDFVVFLKGKAKDSKGFTDEMATSSEYAGARMAKAFEKLRISIGQSFQPAGAAIQDFTTGTIKNLDKVIQKLIELNLIKPGSQFYEAQALAGRAGGVAGLEEQLLQAGQAETGLRDLKSKFGIFGFIINPGLNEAIDKSKKLETALINLRKFEKLTKERQTQQNNEAQANDRAKNLLDAIDKREESIANARRQREEELANIRENAIKQIQAIERKYQDERLNAERELGRLQRELANSREEQALLQREATFGLTREDPAIIEQERRLGEAFARYTEEKINIEETAQDKRIAKERELEDFKKSTADAINKANEKYAKQIGEIQRTYAKLVAKLIEDGSGNGAKRLVAAGKVLAALIAETTKRQTLETLTGISALNIDPLQFGTKQNFARAIFRGALQTEGIPTQDMRKAAFAAMDYYDAVVASKRAQDELNASIKTTANASQVKLPSVSTGDLGTAFGQAQSPADATNKAVSGAQEELNRQKNLISEIQGILTGINNEGQQRIRDLESQNSTVQEQLELIKNGMTPALAEQTVANDEILNALRKRTDALETEVRERARGIKDAKERASVEEAIDKIFKQQKTTISDTRTESEILLKTAYALKTQYEEALKRIEEISARIEQGVTGVTGAYKTLFKEIAMGADSVDALKKAQQAIADQAITMFLDFALKPVEDFFKDALGKVFGIPNQKEEAAKALTVAREQLAKLEEQRKIQQKIESNTAVSAGVPPSTPSGATQSMGGGTTSLPVIPFGAGESQNLQSATAAGGLFTTEITTDIALISASISSASEEMAKSLSKVDASIGQTAVSVGKAAQDTSENGATGKKWQESLGKVVQGIGIAAGAIMGIAAGISQIKEGGTSNVLGGIGSILMSVGGAIGGFGNLFGWAKGGVVPGGFKAFANGGLVQGPTLGLVGEGRYNEAVVPLPDGRSIPVEMRTPSIREIMASSSASSSSQPVLNMKFETTNIAGVEYVSRDQLERAMAETRKLAANDGARRGMGMTLDRLQQSPSTRSKIGLR